MIARGLIVLFLVAWVVVWTSKLYPVMWAPIDEQTDRVERVMLWVMTAGLIIVLSMLVILLTGFVHWFVTGG